ncbi:C39 family peptidase [Methanolobus zinderi]|uniref:C39 family peptidase n=1 Tax=Methanolobus zinderi TaxID=536044 RepID=A0A7D5E777_9EURY|nr:C39 family peptidase [Methanolobus zinderi]QLC50572.1 C39 family peptidase [Methanolobus zinderi]
MSEQGDHVIIRRIDLSFMVKVLCIMLVSCNVAATGDIEKEHADIYSRNNVKTALPVPYYDQGDTSWCLYSCLSMMLSYNNRNIEPWEIASYFDSGHDETFEGQYNVFDNSLENYFSEKCSIQIKRTVWGFNIGNFDVENFDSRIRENIDRGQPVLLAFQYTDPAGAKKGHAIVATGYDEECIYLTDPSGAITEDFFAHKEGHIAVPVSWYEFNERLVREIMLTNLAFTIEITEDAPSSSPDGSIYLVDSTDHNYSHVYFTNRSNKNDVGLLRLDGKYENGYLIVRQDNISRERKISLQDSMSLYFTVANPTPEQKNYTVTSEVVSKESGNKIDNFFFSSEIEVEGGKDLSKGINYSNQIEKLPAGDYSFTLILSDDKGKHIDSLSFELYIP